MRIVQIIDSLEVGGAERMAVNYANSLARKIEFSGLISTRNEGLLLEHLDEKVTYLFLKKKSTIDLSAIFRLRNYLKKNKVDFIHAHSSSFFIAVLVKITMPWIKIIWHDHYGISQDLSLRKSLILKFSSFLFLGIISVNDSLQKWAQDYLNCKNLIYFPNFIIKPTVFFDSFQLKGKDGQRIICVANLRPQKNHELLINGAKEIHKKFPEWTFHLVGKDFNDSYSANLLELVKEKRLSENVFFYGAVNNIQQLLKQSEIAVLTSLSEGLPLAVLEYGLAKLPVVVTDVGEISKVVPSSKEGLVIDSNNLSQFVDSIQILIENQHVRKSLGNQLNFYVNENFGEKSILKEYLIWLKSLTTITK
ncbi:putative alpha-glycosyltransferase [Flavobacterium anhuiense]|uniref:Putative alpha-glycosyltransferase n=1 Tax=Flavobacterium anhuiense TaxID=459526 RepID=A0A444VVV5_9FLAO|nr:glycosyltransferase [Flavobacterium anhuiense]RYJ37817.1 putative alpha-glycosyltransferase [Flavobacterium anhuiense]